MQQISKKPAFELGQIVATPGVLAALKKAGQQPDEFLTRPDTESRRHPHSLSTSCLFRDERRCWK